jgi:hypothetical protein
MTPRRRWRRTNRPQTPRNSLLRSGFCGNRPKHQVKKIARRFERSARVLRLIYVGAVIPPHRLYSARAPIHPKRPIWLDPSGCPPGRVFHFRHSFFEEAASRAAPRGLLMRRLSVRLRGLRDISSRLPKRNYRGTPRNTAMLPCSLTVKSDDNSVFVRISSISASSVASRTGQ